MDSTRRKRLLDAAKQAILATLPDIWAIYVHGSIARNDDMPGSDLDLGLLLPPGRTLPDMLNLKAQLAEATGRETDIADLRLCGNMLRKEVLTYGIPLYVADRETVLAWEARAMSEYAEHRTRIRDLLEDFQQTGIGYGA
jgi:predicted nucleotidyltransferase